MTDELQLYGKTRLEISSVPTGKAIELCYDYYVKDIILFANVLISEFGKEKAGKIISEARHKGPFEEGKKTAAKLGNPKNIDSYIDNYFLRPTPERIEEYWAKSTKAPFWVAPTHFAYRTNNKAVVRTSDYCFKAMAIKRFADEEMCKFLGDYYCIHDVAWANGFNPEMKYKITKNFLWGDDCCEFTFEV
jgi:hypothetical protein